MVFSVNLTQSLFPLSSTKKRRQVMTLRHMAWATAGIWVITFAICIMLHSFGFLDKNGAGGIVGSATFISVMMWAFWAFKDS